MHTGQEINTWNIVRVARYELTFRDQQCHGRRGVECGWMAVHLHDVDRDGERHRVDAVLHGQSYDVCQVLGAVVYVVELVLSNLLVSELVTCSHIRVSKGNDLVCHIHMWPWLPGIKSEFPKHVLCMIWLEWSLSSTVIVKFVSKAMMELWQFQPLWGKKWKGDKTSILLHEFSKI